MLTRRWARGSIARFGIPAVTAYISLITVIFMLVTRAHLSAKEHGNRDQERASHDQGRRQGFQIGEHARLLPRPRTSFPRPAREGIVAHAGSARLVLPDYMRPLPPPAAGRTGRTGT
jgi:hypothetical protein